MKTFICSITCCLVIQLNFCQGFDSIKQLDSTMIGQMPYEMEGRPEDRIPLADFNERRLWKVTTNNCTATLNITKEQRVYRPYSGKVIYTPLNKESSFTI